MKCENLQPNISLYLDDELDEHEQGAADAHFDSCPVCRDRLAEYRALRQELRSLKPAPMPADLLASIRSAAAIQLQPAPIFNLPQMSETNFADRFRQLLMPYAVGTLASFFIAFIVLSAMFTNNRTIADNQNSAKNSSVVLMASKRNYDGEELMITPAEYAAARIRVAGESPSVNPAGALVALTKSLVRGKMNDDEVVVVADVFSNGAAKISEVVEAPKNHGELEQLEKALQQDPNDPAFLPADFDKRSDVVRVVLKIQNVEVREDAERSKNSRRRK